MPMIVDPSAPLVEPPARVTSPDGYLAALVDEQWAGVVLSYDAATPPDTARNLALNPSGVGLTDTQSYGPSITRASVATDPRFGSSCIQHTHTAASSAGTTWTIQDAPAGTTVQVGIWVKVPAGVTSGQITWRSGTTTLRNESLSALPPVGVWTRISAAYTVAAGQTANRVGVAFTSPLGAVWWADACMAEPGSALHPYVDGDQPGCVWDGTPHASTSRRVTTPMAPQNIRKLRIVRQDTGATAPVPVRSADPAWAIEGVGTAYDHEAPLGVAVVYTATPIYVDGTTGPSSALAVTVPAPDPGPRDVWIKSLDDPGLSVRATVTSWPELTWAARIDSAAVQGSAFPVASQDVYAASASTITIDAEGEQIEALERLLVTPGVRLIQTRPDYHRPDQYVLLSDIQQAMTSTPTQPRSYQAALTQVARPDTAGQPMRMPAWSWDQVAAQFASFDATVASYSSWASLSTDGAT